MQRWIFFILSCLAFSVVYASNSLLLLPDQTLEGLSLGQLGERWWTWVSDAPSGKDPVEDQSGMYCAIHQTGKTWFLAGTYAGNKKVIRHCVIPFGKTLVGPLINVYGNCEQIKEWNTIFDKPLSLTLTIDKVTFSKTQLLAYRSRLNCGMSKVNPGLSFDGYYYMIKPLSKGKHVISYKAATTQFTQDVSYTITVK
jgi:hypothetical protein